MYRELLMKSMDILKFTDAIKSAKKTSPQTFIFHSVSVGTLALAICEEIGKVFPDDMKRLQDLYNVDDFRSLCYFSGFFHDWMKLYSVEEEGRFKIQPNAMNNAKELAKQTGIQKSELLIEHLATYAEGHVVNRDEIPLWISVKIADMLMISDITSVTDVFEFAKSGNYRDAIKELEDSYGFHLHYIKSSDRLFVLLASEDIVNKVINGRALISYKDGVVYLTRANDKISLKSIYNIFYSRIHGGTDINKDISEASKRIEECIKLKEEVWTNVNVGKYEVLYNKDGKPKQVNVVFPSKKCNYFEDIVGLLEPNVKLNVALKVISDLKDDIPYAVLAYFLEKFSSKDDEYIRKALNIKDKFPKYINSIGNNVDLYINKLIEALKSRYSSMSSPWDNTLLSFVKKSFTGSDMVDDLPSINVSPKNYCTVCGMPIYEDSVRFKEYNELLKGKTEIWIPRERGLAEIDSIRDSWAICPICNYEAKEMKSEMLPPYIIVSFYPAIPIDLLRSLSFDSSKLYSDFTKEDNKKTRLNPIYNDVMTDKSFKQIYEEAGGDIIRREDVTNSSSKNVKPDYLGSKIVIGLKDVLGERISTRLTKNELNMSLSIVPFISIVYLGAPLFISSNIYDFPLVTRNFTVMSDINYNWVKGDDNYSTLLLLLSYRAKYSALKNYSTKNEFENNLNSMVNEMDLYASVDKSLSIISTGMAVDDKFFSNIKFFARFLNFSLEKVSKMGESFSRSLGIISSILNEVIKDKNPSKHDVIGFLRDGIDIFFKTTIIKEKEDRVNIAASTALNTLQTKYSIGDEMSKRIYPHIRDIFSNLYEIEEKSDRSLAISISNSIVNWLYVLFLYKKSGESS
ncbi:CRISPR-associated protein [Sulfolobus sp. E5-1-F]|uniref:CRISPR-associated protein n=1 Tax=Saccharolobus sp. E5-1-F TaxID=2663019 RepID=UPI001296D680|nr:CRISPR-associated protein [Sulfolobus sp. E5-1-F]QGA53941.1 CRISPR-associated protein [Sulfolobus sp. E5-1-F]